MSTDACYNTDEPWKHHVSERGQRPYMMMKSTQKGKRIPEKTSTSAYWLCQSLWLCRSQQTGKFLKRWEYQTTLPASWEICMQAKKQPLETDMINRLQIGKGMFQGCIMSPCLFNLYAEYILWNASWMKHKLGSRLLGEIPIISVMQMTPPL